MIIYKVDTGAHDPLYQAESPGCLLVIWMQAQLSKQLTALSSQVVHLQSEIMRRGQLSGQLQEQLQAGLPISHINGHESTSEAMSKSTLQLRTSTPEVDVSSSSIHPEQSPVDGMQQEAPDSLNSPSGSERAAETTDAARQPGESCFVRSLW